MSTSVKNQVLEWNIKYPFDYIWRKKYNVAYGSAVHRETSHVDMVFDLYENSMYMNMNKDRETQRFTEEDIDLMSEQGLQDGKKVVKMTQDEIDKEFEEIDLKAY